MSSEDDEVIVQGNPLYKYMEEVGVADLDEISVAKPNAAPPEAMELLPDGFVASAVVPEHVHRLLKTIFNSHLLFDDDYNFVMSCVPDRTVKANRYRRGWAAVTAAAAVNVGVVAINQYLVSNLLRNLSVIPGCLVTVGSAGYVGKLIFDSCSEKRVEKDMENHVKIMQKFYKLLQRIISDIRDIDVISRGSGLRNQPPEAHDPKAFVPLAKFRIAIVTTLIDINSAMSCGFHSLKELLPESIKQTDFAISSTRSLIFENMEFIETRMSASDLNNLNRVYQLVQSEYLRWLALCYCPVHPKNEKLAKKTCAKVIDSVHSVLVTSYTELNFQYAVNLCGRKSGVRSVGKRKVLADNHVDALAVGVHSIMMHLVSLMEEVKRLESSVNISSSLISEGKQSAEDFLKTFAIKFNEFKIKLRNTNDHIFKIDTDLKKRITTISSPCLGEANTMKSTQEHLSGTSVGVNAVELTGKSDFSIHGEHEVFIGTSSGDAYVAADTGEECVFERRQLLPNVLGELKSALKPVYEMHAERERQALLRTGRSYLETVEEEELSVNTSECSSGVKDSDEINSPRLANIDEVGAVLDSSCDNIAAHVPVETGTDEVVNRCDTVVLSISSAVGDSSQIDSSRQGAGVTDNDPCNVAAANIVSMTSEIETSRMNPKDRDLVSDSLSSSVVNVEAYSDTVSSAYVVEPDEIDSNLATSTPVFPDLDICEVTSTSADHSRVFDTGSSACIVELDEIDTFLATSTPVFPDLDDCEGTSTSSVHSCVSITKDSSEHTVNVPCTQTEDNNEGAAGYSMSVFPSPISEGSAASYNPDASQTTFRRMSGIDQRSDIQETLLTGIGNLKMVTRHQALAEEQFVYDGKSDSESSD